MQSTLESDWNVTAPAVFHSSVDFRNREKAQARRNTDLIDMLVLGLCNETGAYAALTCDGAHDPRLLSSYERPHERGQGRDLAIPEGFLLPAQHLNCLTWCQVVQLSVGNVTETQRDSIIHGCSCTRALRLASIPPHHCGLPVCLLCGD